MSRWNEVVTLISHSEPYQDDDFMWHEGEQTERTIFCSPRIVGTMTMAQLHSSDVRITNGETIPEVGLRKMVMVRVRTLEYNDEQQVIYRGEEMEVIAVTEVGENSDLLMRRKLGND
ncbi:MAG: hypothetical protein IKF14_18330 [Atopobiaceae bacterium]|nr:hypothetical protein [Atopobiaceae bacterium]MBR3161047.1 hypothetical protein [Atopobiaceae bacterium]